MDYKKGIMYGAAIWGIMFVVVSALVGFNLSNASLMSYVTILVSGVVAYVFAGMIAAKDAKDALTYGIVWAAVGLALDFLISARFATDIFTSWSLWVGYALVVLAPVVRLQLAKK